MINSRDLENKASLGLQKRRKQLFTFATIVTILLGSIFAVVAFNTLSFEEEINYPPKVFLASPAHNGVSTDALQEFRWEIYDVNEDDVSSYLEIDTVGTFNSPNFVEYSCSNTERKIVELRDGAWFWRIRAEDGKETTHSTIKRVYMNSHTLNSIPSLQNYSIFPEQGIVTTEYTLHIMDLSNSY